VRLIPKGPVYDWLVEKDKKLARLFGFSGLFTLSAECSGSRALACKCMCQVMNLIEEDHCNKAAKSEGK
jgi:hypothetical protein